MVFCSTSPRRPARREKATWSRVVVVGSVYRVRAGRANVRYSRCHKFPTGWKPDQRIDLDGIRRTGLHGNPPLHHSTAIIGAHIAPQFSVKRRAFNNRFGRRGWCGIVVEGVVINEKFAPPTVPRQHAPFQQVPLPPQRYFLLPHRSGASAMEWAPGFLHALLP